MNGGDALVDALLALGVDTGFTVPGESFLNVLEALRVKRDSFRLVSTRHESGGTFAAEAYGKLSGRPAAVFVSRGPGATNAAIGIHTARQSSTPLLLFVGHVRTRSKGREAFQEIDHHRMFAPVAKAVMEPESAADIQRVTGQAVHASMAGRPGPVVVVLPRDLTEARVDDALPAAPVDTIRPRVPEESIQDALDAVSAAQFPIIIAGEIVSHERAGDVLVEFAEKLAAPVVTAYRQMDVFPNHHPAYAGHLDINRAAFQRDAFARADLVLAIGTRLDGITTEDYSLLRADQRLVHLVCDNQAHGSILYAQRQQFDGDSDYATRLASPDFVAVARAYGVPAWRVGHSAEFPAFLQAAMDGDGPSLLHLVTDQRDIVPGGAQDDVV